MNNQSIKICVLGLGYVGLPLLEKLSQYFDTIGFDVDTERVSDIKCKHDRTNEVDLTINHSYISVTDKPEEIAACNMYIVTVPTPVDDNKVPDFSYLITASQTISQYLCKGDLIIYESTVYPSATEEVCVPALLKNTNLEYFTDFNVGYSPERINPGDKENTLDKITKLISADNERSLALMEHVYSKVTNAGIYKCSSIKVAEMAKVIENTQRDVNIALINEVAIICDKLNISCRQVLDAASTKWNFLKFHPGLVGGHCIGVDPYYLTHTAKELQYTPEVILAGRRLNDSMSQYVVSKINELVIKKKMDLKNLKVLMLGATFKPDCPDIRNSKALDIYKYFIDSGFEITLVDPLVVKMDHEYITSKKIQRSIPNGKYNIILLAVAHQEFKQKIETIISARAAGNDNIIVDLTNTLPTWEVDYSL